MTISIDGNIPMILFLSIGVFAGLILFSFPFFLLGMRHQKRKEPKDRVKVADARNEQRKAEENQRKAEEKVTIFESEVIYLHNVSHEFVRQINNFMRRMRIKEDNDEHPTIEA